jgi:hypothetical protein
MLPPQCSPSLATQALPASPSEGLVSAQPPPSAPSNQGALTINATTKTEFGK